MKENINTGNSDYIPFPLSSIFPSRPLPGNIYIAIGNKYLKYKEKEDEIPKERYEVFVYKQLKYLFIKTQDLQKFEEWGEKLKKKVMDTVTKKVGKKNIDLVSQHFALKAAALNFITKEKVTSRDIKQMVDHTRKLIKQVIDRKAIENFMLALISYDQGAADHGTNVASLSVFLALNIGYSQQIILENVYLGGLFHDYGKTQLNKNILDDPDHPDYIKEMEKHPEMGRTTLMSESGFSEEVLKIIGEHHERVDGLGFPDGLKRIQIYDLTKVVSIANVFDNLVMRLDGPINIRQKKAIQMLEMERKKMFDPKILEKATRALKSVILK